MTETQHPAQLASFRSPQMVKEKKKAQWLDLFAEDAVIQDPVGPSPLDPEGKGHRGKEAISRFWDTVIEGGNFDFVIHQSFPCGNECANVWVGINQIQGFRFETPMVTVYKVDDKGKILSLRAFWDFNKVAKDLEQLTSGA